MHCYQSYPRNVDLKTSFKDSPSLELFHDQTTFSRASRLVDSFHFLRIFGPTPQLISAKFTYVACTYYSPDTEHTAEFQIEGLSTPTVIVTRFNLRCES